ncbi:MAG: Tex family protein [Burkholderiaceae bacterium]
MSDIVARLAQELNIRPAQAIAAVALLDDGATVPFIARYRKEATDGLDDIQLRELEARLFYLRELAERRETILKSIDDQGKLTDVLREAIFAAETKQALEDIYLPYKPRRRTKGQMAIEAGLLPLATQLFADPTLDPHATATAFLVTERAEGDPDFSTTGAVLDGVRDILSEQWAEDAVLLNAMREWLWDAGYFQSKLASGQNETNPDTAKFRDYFDYQEPIKQVPSHRALAVFRGRSLNLLDAKLVLDEVLEPGVPSIAEGYIAKHVGWRHQGRPSDDLLRRTVTWTWKVKLSLSLERDLFNRLRESAEQVAIKVFGNNLRDLLLAAPAGNKAVMGLDPGIRTGVKVAVVDGTGKLVATETVYPHEPRKDWDGARHALTALCTKYGVALIAIGNGTASRETDKLAADVIKQLEKASAPGLVQKLVVSEAGASIYSASAFASQELPDVDVSLRGAVSIARRVQDPLAELVKIDPKSIGVGQYQHDVNQTDLAKQLEAVVEDCVNAVGVDLNTASVPLLSRVSGLSPTVAKALVRWRDTHGAFASRDQLMQVSGLGPKTYEQSAGFLRIRDGQNPLDMTGVHPETYPVVERLLKNTGLSIDALIGQQSVLRQVKPETLTTDQFGVVTVQDILLELEKPGRDPRPDFQVARFNDGVEDINDLVAGMVLEGTVSNVAAFGAFIDIGVHQDGLVHVSQLSNRFVSHAHEVVKAGDIVKVKVVEVDVARKRISLTMRLDAPAPQKGVAPADNRFQHADRNQQRRADKASDRSTQAPSAMANAFSKLQQLQTKR